jgi:succinyl-diaminopimelate desuccinylase
MKYLMDEGKIPEHTSLRMIVGTNEEEDWGGINYYVEHVDKLPDYSIVPDAAFPLINCEKGLLDFDVSMKIQELEEDAELVVKNLRGGAAKNIVAGKLYATLGCGNMKEKKLAAKLNEYDHVEATAGIGEVEIMVQGKPCHAMSPEKGLNAISVFIKLLNDLPWTTSIDPFVDVYSEIIGMGYNGKETGIGFEDDLSGLLTQNVGVIHMEDDVITLECNIRYPASLEKEATITAIREAWETAGFDFEEKAYLPPVYIRPDSDFVQKLMGVYQEVTGDTESKPMAIGGATYARGIPNAIAFGPVFPYEEELAHEADEYIDLDSLEKMTEIYIRAMEELLNM